MLAEGGGVTGGVGGVRSKEMDELRERLRISEHLMADMSKSWEEKLKETERIHKVGVIIQCTCVYVLKFRHCMYMYMRLYLSVYSTMRINLSTDKLDRFTYMYPHVHTVYVFTMYMYIYHVSTMSGYFNFCWFLSLSLSLHL